MVSPDGEVLGEGAHEGPGHPHAEVVALDLAHDARRATVYTSLEPCTVWGRTAPCVDRLIAEGVARVVVGTMDPDVRVSGTGVDALREAGIDVEVMDDPRARAIDPGYFHHRETGMPMVTVKWAMTVDGSVAAADDTSQWITSDSARAEVHELRSEVDAVVVGAGTLRADDPRLDVRLPDYAGPQPRAVVVAGQEELPQEARLWQRDPVVVAVEERFIPSGELVIVEGEDYPEPVRTCEALAEMGYLELLLEGGPTLAGAWWRAGVIDRGHVYIANKIGGGEGRSPMSGVFPTIGVAHEVEFETVRNVSDDVSITFKKKA